MFHECQSPRGSSLQAIQPDLFVTHHEFHPPSPASSPAIPTNTSSSFFPSSNPLSATPLLQTTRLISADKQIKKIKNKIPFVKKSPRLQDYPSAGNAMAVSGISLCFKTRRTIHILPSSSYTASGTAEPLNLPLPTLTLTNVFHTCSLCPVPAPGRESGLVLEGWCCFIKAASIPFHPFHFSWQNTSRVPTSPGYKEGNIVMGAHLSWQGCGFWHGSFRTRLQNVCRNKEQPRPFYSSFLP